MMDETAPVVRDMRAEWKQTRLLMRRPWLDDLPLEPTLPPGYSLRTYRDGDLAQLAGVLTCAFGEPWDEERVLRILIDAADVEETYIIETDGKVVATSSARLLPERFPGSGFVHWVAADPDYQGIGLGSIASRRVLEYFRARGDLRDAVLETQTHRLPAIRTYLRLGFVPEYPGMDDDELLRWALLLPAAVR